MTYVGKLTVRQLIIDPVFASFQWLGNRHILCNNAYSADFLMRHEVYNMMLSPLRQHYKTPELWVSGIYTGRLQRGVAVSYYL